MTEAEIDEAIEDMIDEIEEILDGKENAIVLTVLVSLLAQCIESGAENDTDKKYAMALVIMGLTEALELNAPIGNA